MKVNTSRLMGFLRGHIDLYRQVELRAIYPFISIRNSDEGIKITIKSDKSYKRIIANTDMVGNTTITLDKVSREHVALVRRAEAVVRESK